MLDEFLNYRSLGEVLRVQAGRFPERPFLSFEGRELTFGAVEEYTNRLANVLRGRGIVRGDRVALMLPNGLNFPLAWLALAKLGAVLVPLNIQYRERDLRYVLLDSGARLVVGGKEQLETLEKVRPACPELAEICLFEEAPYSPDSPGLGGEIARAASDFEPVELAPEALLNIQYTSGTTGFPKGCMLSHEYWIRLGWLAAGSVAAGEHDIDLTAQPFYYIDPQWNTVLCLMAGIKLVILPRFSASTFWQSIRDNRVTFFYIIGSMPIYLMKQPPDPALEKQHQVRVALCSGIPPQLHAGFEERWNTPWREAYGLTETGCDLIMPLDSAGMAGSGAMGRLVPGKEARVVDLDGQAVADGEVGELVIRGKPMMLGYWNNPEATARTIRDGWLHTGDLVRRDREGYFYMVGRLKDMIRRGGENIAASEVEYTLCEHPAVNLTAVVAVPDELRGEEVKAYIQLKPGETVEPQALVAFVRERLAAFKAPRYLQFVDELPLTPSGKVAKTQLQARLGVDNRVYDALQQVWQK